MTPEARARQTIGVLLMQAGWHVCSTGDINIHAARGVALREFPLNIGFGLLTTCAISTAKPLARLSLRRNADG